MARHERTLQALNLVQANLPSMDDAFFKREGVEPISIIYSLDPATGFKATFSKGGWTNAVGNEMIHYSLTFTRGVTKEVLPTLNAYVKGPQTVQTARQALGVIIDFFILAPVTISSKDWP